MLLWQFYSHANAVQVGAEGEARTTSTKAKDFQDRSIRIVLLQAATVSGKDDGLPGILGLDCSVCSFISIPKRKFKPNSIGSYR